MTYHLSSGLAGTFLDILLYPGIHDSPPGAGIPQTSFLHSSLKPGSVIPALKNSNLMLVVDYANLESPYIYSETTQEGLT